MERLKKYLDRHGVRYTTVPEWALIFGDSPDGVYVARGDFQRFQPMVERLGLRWSWRGNYASAYIAPVA